MSHRRIAVAVLLMLSLLAPAGLSVAQGPPDLAAQITAEDAMQHVRALSLAIGARPMGSEAEQKAADYITASFESWGYTVEVQEFETTPPGQEEGDTPDPVTSRNVIATRAGDEQWVVVGAHMDSVTDGTGAGDNASGVGAMLAAAEALSTVDLPHTLVFIAFGAEESGDPTGAAYYVDSLGSDLDKVIAMINLDSVGVGTTVNVYAGARVTWPEEEGAAPTLEGGPTWVRDVALDLAAELNLPIGTTPDETWGGYTGDWSDHYAFVLKEVPIAYFEAWQWEGAEDPWWGQETANGDVMHTPGDIYANVVPEKVELAAELLAATVDAIASGAAQPQE